MATTRVDRAIVWIKNNRITSLFIFLGVVVIALGAFTDAIVKILSATQTTLDTDSKGSTEDLVENTGLTGTWSGGRDGESIRLTFEKKSQLRIEIQKQSGTSRLTGVYRILGPKLITLKAQGVNEECLYESTPAKALYCQKGEIRLRREESSE